MAQDERTNPTVLRADGLRVLTVEETAVHLKTTTDVVRKLIASGELKAKKLSPRNTRISEKHLFAFIHR